MTGKRLYQEVWASAQSILKNDSLYRENENIWWQQPKWKEALESDRANLLGLKPFVLKMVDRSGFVCC